MINVTPIAISELPAICGEYNREPLPMLLSERNGSTTG